MIFSLFFYNGMTADLGYSDGIEYFLGNNQQTALVSPLVYYFSLVQGYSLFLTHPLAVLAFFYEKTILPYERKVIQN